MRSMASRRILCYLPSHGLLTPRKQRRVALAGLPHQGITARDRQVRLTHGLLPFSPLQVRPGLKSLGFLSGFRQAGGLRRQANLGSLFDLPDP